MSRRRRRDLNFSRAAILVRPDSVIKIRPACATLTVFHTYRPEVLDVVHRAMISNAIAYKIVEVTDHTFQSKFPTVYSGVLANGTVVDNEILVSVMKIVTDMSSAGSKLDNLARTGNFTLLTRAPDWRFFNVSQDYARNYV
jgi:hypothetical protein